jgi:hypothetical protein
VGLQWAGVCGGGGEWVCSGQVRAAEGASGSAVGSQVRAAEEEEEEACWSAVARCARRRGRVGLAVGRCARRKRRVGLRWVSARGRGDELVCSEQVRRGRVGLEWANARGGGAWGLQWHLAG